MPGLTLGTVSLSGTTLTPNVISVQLGASRLRDAPVRRGKPAGSRAKRAGSRIKPGRSHRRRPGLS